MELLVRPGACRGRLGIHDFAFGCWPAGKVGGIALKRSGGGTCRMAVGISRVDAGIVCLSRLVCFRCWALGVSGLGGGEVGAGLVRDRIAGLDLVGHDEIFSSLMIFFDLYEVDNLGMTRYSLSCRALRIQGVW